jgi:hypothetical protein
MNNLKIRFNANHLLYIFIFIIGILVIIISIINIARWIEYYENMGLLNFLAGSYLPILTGIGFILISLAGILQNK